MIMAKLNKFSIKESSKIFKDSKNKVSIITLVISQKYILFIINTNDEIA